MRNTINAAFHTVEHSRDEIAPIEYDLNQNVDEDSKPYAH